MTSSTYAELHIQGIPVHVYIGISEEERVNMQNLAIDFKMTFKSLPVGCTTDDIADTFCYHTLYKIMKSKFDASVHNLIEHLAMEMLTFFSENLKTDNLKAVEVTTNKIAPIRGLTGNVAFTLKKSF